MIRQITINFPAYVFVGVLLGMGSLLGQPSAALSMEDYQAPPSVTAGSKDEPAAASLEAPPKPITAPVRNMRTDEMIKRWQQLSVTEQENLRKRLRQYQSLPTPQQERLKKDFKEFQKLPPPQRRRLQENHLRLERLSPGERKHFDDNYRRFMTFSDARKSTLREKARQIHSLPPLQQERVMRELRERYLAGLQPEPRPKESDNTNVESEKKGTQKEGKRIEPRPKPYTEKKSSPASRQPKPQKPTRRAPRGH
ncbi:MAG: DUF3106 domain-containing protein [Acidobacteria bacterium]|nr:DUF3106 domain-containing protein [Acidobacteriota bacterium]MBI3656226.1 DUF3106 domain-containing protein [Acidobacteriota bacterium]